MVTSLSIDRIIGIDSVLVRFFPEQEPIDSFLGGIGPEVGYEQVRMDGIQRAADVLGSPRRGLGGRECVGHRRCFDGHGIGADECEALTLTQAVNLLLEVFQLVADALLQSTRVLNFADHFTDLDELLADRLAFRETSSGRFTK